MMKHFSKATMKKAAALSALLMCAAPLAPAPSGVTGSYITSVAAAAESKGDLDWANEEVVAVGYGLAPTNASPAQGRILARRSAIVNAQREALDFIKGASIDAETVVENLFASDKVSSRVDGVIRNARIVDEGMQEDGVYFVKISVPLYGATGSVASAVLPSVRSNAAPAPFLAPSASVSQAVRASVQGTYTGVIIDASGLGLKPTFSPVVYDTAGRAIYGATNIDPDLAISKGMVGYADSVEAAKGLARAGSNPLVVKAVQAKGGASANNLVNVVVSADDAERILIANEKSNLLADAAVIFIR